MENLILNTTIRTTEEKLSELRMSSMVPAVVYGKHQEPILIKMDNSDFLRIFRKSGQSHLINLKIDKIEIEVLVYQIQKEPISGDFLHIDFYAITRGEKLTTNIPFNFIGTAQAVKEGGIIEEHMKEVEVKVLPKNLVDSFDVDLSSLKEIGDNIWLSEINIDTTKFDIITPDSVIVSTSRPKVEVIPDDAPEAPESDEIENEKPVE